MFWFLMGFVGVFLHIFLKIVGAHGEKVNFSWIKGYFKRHAGAIVASVLTYVVIFAMWRGGEVPILKEIPLTMSPVVGYLGDSIWRNLTKWVSKKFKF